jgi:hypothetical protein
MLTNPQPGCASGGNPYSCQLGAEDFFPWCQGFFGSRHSPDLASSECFLGACFCQPAHLSGRLGLRRFCGCKISANPRNWDSSRSTHPIWLQEGSIDSCDLCQSVCINVMFMTLCTMREVVEELRESPLSSSSLYTFLNNRKGPPVGPLSHYDSPVESHTPQWVSQKCLCAHCEGLGSLITRTPQLSMWMDKRLEDEGHLRVLCSIYAILDTCDYTRLY